MKILYYFILIIFIISSKVSISQVIIPGAERLSNYIDYIKDKKVGVIANQSSVIGKTHLVDSLICLGINIRGIYCPEHGFRGDAQAGAIIHSSIDSKTRLPITSLYGNNKKPMADEFKNNEVVVFDLQDVGTRFYTYISTLHYVMEACAENNIPLIVLDRPNPNAYYIDGPVLKDTLLVSFVGMHPVPIVYGLTIGEYAIMINGESWLGTSSKRVIGEKGGLKCDLYVVPIQNYTHNTMYSLPIPPSPNLKNDNSINLYPSLCWFEGSPISVGRGTDYPFEIIGFPGYKSIDKKFENIIYFTPKPIRGVSDNPLYNNQLCRGIKLYYPLELDSNQGDLRILNIGGIDLSYLIHMYNSYPDKLNFFKGFFDKLAGTRELKTQIRQGMSEEHIRSTWQKDIEDYKKTREKYLMY